MKNLLAAAAIIAVGVGSSAACASKGYVRNRVGEVNTKVEALGGSLEETQERTRKNEARIEEVNARTDQVNQRAEAANRAAAEARDAAGAAGMRAEEVDKATKRLIFEVVLNEDQGNFKFNNASLPEEAKVRIDEMINQLKADPKNVFIEVEGHTDATGNPLVNQRIGQERADSVKRYLYEAHQIPLHKINVISYGEEKPVAPNNTRDGRAQNRRVVIKVLA
jgi:outer membrane protein OmpA-like peptidoglycan-associated protein